MNHVRKLVYLAIASGFMLGAANDRTRDLPYERVKLKAEDELKPVNLAFEHGAESSAVGHSKLQSDYHKKTNSDLHATDVSFVHDANGSENHSSTDSSTHRPEISSVHTPIASDIHEPSNSKKHTHQFYPIWVIKKTTQIPGIHTVLCCLTNIILVNQLLIRLL